VPQEHLSYAVEPISSEQNIFTRMVRFMSEAIELERSASNLIFLTVKLVQHEHCKAFQFESSCLELIALSFCSTFDRCYFAANGLFAYFVMCEATCDSLAIPVCQPNNMQFP